MMNQEDIFKKIGLILNELQDQYDFLAQNPQQLNELELELFLANANFLSDHVHIVKKANSSRVAKAISEPQESSFAESGSVVQIAEVIVQPPPPRPIAEPQIEQIEIEELHQEDLIPAEHERPSFQFMLSEEPVSDQFDFEQKSVDEIFDRPLSEEEQRIIAEKQKQNEYKAKPEFSPEPQVVHSPITQPSEVQPVAATHQEIFPVDKIEEKQVEPLTAQTPVLDKVEDKLVQPEVIPNTARPTLNDLLAGRNSGLPSFNEESSKPAVTDLKGGISLNEKLLYIKDLFNGYNLAYSEAIDLINKMPDMKTADVFLQKNYAEKNNWSSKQATVDKFYTLLAQRFPEG